jgi:hypothetical protein
MFSSPGTNSCISGHNFVKDKSDTLPPCSLAAAKMISAFVDFLAVCIFKDLEKDDCMWDSMSVDAIKKIDARENKMKEEIGKYAQGLRDNHHNFGRT